MNAPGKIRLSAGGFLFAAILVVLSSEFLAGGYLGLVVLVGTDRSLEILGKYGKTEG